MSAITMNINEINQFSRESDGTPRTEGQAIVAWWLGNWATAEKIHTQAQLQSLAAMIDAALAVAVTT